MNAELASRTPDQVALEILEGYADLNGNEAAEQLSNDVLHAAARYAIMNELPIKTEEFPYIDPTVATVLDVFRLIEGGEFSPFGFAAGFYNK